MPNPELTRQPILFVDGTPDEDYPLRILLAYRRLCDSCWAEATDGSEPSNPLFQLMNLHQQQRAEILDRAIAALRRAR